MIINPNTDWVLSQDGTHHFYSKPLETPANDDRQYRLVRLANQLEVLLISDPETDRASAALDVHVGNLSDPDNLQGLAHFCEHLLFMGTEKYPKENDYYSYLSEHSGYANAWTGAENTNYYFEVGHQWLEGALDRFAHFFIDPLFSDSCTDRELRAVDSEHKKNLQSDSWRVSQVEKSLSNPNHPWHKFQTGNLETLMETPKRLGLNVREELLRFHNNYYSANIMRLCILGKESLDQLTQWAVEKFSDVRDKNIKVPTYPGHPLGQNELLKQILVKSVKHTRLLEITFPFPDQSPYYETQPANYLSHLIGHEGTGSILSYLKKKGWATFLSSGCYDAGEGFSFYHASVDLTEQGLEHYEDVVIAFFQYVDMLKKNGTKKWIFDEVQSLSAIEFKFSEKSSPSQYTSWLTQCMQAEYPPHMTISGSSLLRTYDPKLIDEHLNLLNIHNFRLTLSSQDFPKGIKCTKIERWYKTEYEVLPISDDLILKLTNLEHNDEFTLPIINEFVPRKLDVDKQIVKEKQRKPNLIQETSTLRLWHKKDDTFWIPKTTISILFRNPLINATPRHTVIGELYVCMLVDSLTEYTYNAEVAGLSYYLYTPSNGFLLEVSGYSDKLPLLLEKVVQRMKTLQFSPDRFAVMKDLTDRSYRNFYMDAPFQHAAYHMTYAVREQMWKCDDLSSELKDISMEEVESTYRHFISHLHMEVLVHGNLTAEESTTMIRSVENILQPRPLMASQFISNRTIILPPGHSYVYQLPVHDPEEVNSAIEFYCQVCDVTDIELRTRLSLMSQIAQEPCFNQLRTTEQLGYIVISGIRRHVGMVGLRLIIQSERDTVYLENRVMEFLEITLRDILVNMKDDDFKAQVDSLIADKKEKFNNMGQEGSKYWADIESGYYEFDGVDKDVAELGNVTKESMVAFYDKYINPTSPDFRKLSVHLQSQKEPEISQPKFTLESLHACLTNHHTQLLQQQRDTSGGNINSPTMTLTLDDLKRTVGKDIHAGLPTDVILRKLLVDELKTKEEDVEALLAHLSKTMMIDAPSITTNDDGTTTGDQTITKRRDHTKLPDGNIIINDLIKFKHQMPLSPAAVPFFLFSRI
ncbi:Metalloenzyme, LuxS/M16 peptidase-like protein [Halteromyces radiatus]|uniref:Metalloenzyme, LuxS/M16 peptidase-like protein n=1 Tax=Halteromyces radiatus TaxID=101107 RepID=UPI0022201545|nr:Metalloenzyme, LuxS/M16 peptidase-like protein [Halteromyces radiatus]KAI8077795.1 Metalloenzyme, LuxS/M16 peptidase-like protein [Halteromyces radiatus]